jgi:hypothetical protein
MVFAYIKEGVIGALWPANNPSEAQRLTLLGLRLVCDLDHLAPTVGSAAFADMVRAHQLAALLAGHQRRRSQALVLAPVAAAVARDFGLWYGTHLSYLLLLYG